MIRFLCKIREFFGSYI